jgi:SAM-dependent methyltransferase
LAGARNHAKIRRMEENIKTFNEQSAEYFRNRPQYPAEIYAYLSSNCRGHDTAWDCACGNGQVAVDLVPYFSTIEASDISEEQIKNGFTHDKIHYSLQNAESTDFPDACFDLVVVAQALHWFNPELFFREVRRTLKPGGIFSCWGYGFFKTEQEIDNLIHNDFLVHIDPFWADNNRLLISGYKDIHFPFAELKHPGFSLTVTWDRKQLLNYMLTWSAVKLYIKEHGRSLVHNLETALARCWPSGESKPVAMDFVFYAGRHGA